MDEEMKEFELSGRIYRDPLLQPRPLSGGEEEALMPLLRIVIQHVTVEELPSLLELVLQPKQMEAAQKVT
jgi:hypothetical protein